MAWIESHQALAQHPKTRRLCRALDVTRVQAIGHLHLLWWWALDYAPDGNVERFAAGDLADACDWSGDPDALIEGLRQAGFLDGNVLHDWDDYGGKFERRRQQSRARQQRYRAQQTGDTPVTDASVTKISSVSHADVTRDSSVSDATQRVSHAARGQDKTQQDKTGEDGGPTAGAVAPPASPKGSGKPVREAKRRTRLPDDWQLSDQDRAFAREHGLSGREIAHNEKKFRSYHTSQASLMADWAAAWRTWVLKEVERSPGGLRASVGDVPIENNGRPAEKREMSEEDLSAWNARRDEEARKARDAEAAAQAAALAAAETDPQRAPWIKPATWAGMSERQRSEFWQGR